MGVVALVLALLALLVSLLPSFGLTQMLGISIGALALVLALIAKGRVRVGEGNVLVARLALGLSVAAIFASIAVFATCQLVTQEAGRKIGEELKKESGGGARGPKVPSTK